MDAGGGGYTVVESFALKQQYETATYESNHPGVKLWVENAAKSVMELVYSSSGSPKQATVSIVILEGSDPVERFGITVTNFELQPSLQSSQLSQSEPQVDPTDVSEKFRSCLVRLYASTPEHPELSPQPNRSMTILYEGNIDSSEVPNTWISAEPSREQKGGRMFPIRSIEIEDDSEGVVVLNTFRQSAVQPT